MKCNFRNRSAFSLVTLLRLETLKQGWGTCLISRAAWIVHYCWRTAINNWVYPKILLLSNHEEEWLLLTYYVSTCLSWSSVLRRCCTLTWITKILMRTISNVHGGRIWPADRGFPTPALNQV